MVDHKLELSAGGFSISSGLQAEIDAAQRRVKTDAYQMSIGEIVNMYKEGDFVINPDFQRLFRWSPAKNRS